MKDDIRKETLPTRHPGRKQGFDIDRARGLAERVPGVKRQKLHLPSVR